MRGQLSRALSQFRKYNNSQMYLVAYLLISALIVDAVIVSVSDFLQDQIVSPSGTVLFILTGFLFIIGQYAVLKYVKRKTKDIRSKFRYLDILYKMATVIQYAPSCKFNRSRVSKLYTLHFCPDSTCGAFIQMVSLR
jgi:hypothetical protein